MTLRTQPQFTYILPLLYSFTFLPCYSFLAIPYFASYHINHTVPRPPRAFRLRNRIYPTSSIVNTSSSRYLIFFHIEIHFKCALNLLLNVSHNRKLFFLYIWIILVIVKLDQIRRKLIKKKTGVNN